MCSLPQDPAPGSKLSSEEADGAAAGLGVDLPPVRRVAVAASAGAAGKVAGPVDGWLAAVCPTLHAMMRWLVDREGVPRETTTLFIVAEEGAWKVGVHDRVADVWLWSAGATVEAALRSADRHALEGTREWRKAKGKRPR